MFKFIKKAVRFCKEVIVVAANRVSDFIDGLWRHKWSTTVLTFSAIGVSSFIGTLPFLVSLPMWIEAPLVVPVIAVLVVLGMTKMMERDGKRYRKRPVAVAA